jgi:hypothetical protein
MGLVETGIVYAALGMAVAGAMALRDDKKTGADLAGQLALGFLFWPLFAPTVLAARSPQSPASDQRPPNLLSPRIRAAEERLLAAIARVDGGVAAQALAPEVARIRALGGSLDSMARRLADIDELLGSPEFDAEAALRARDDVASRASGADDPRVASIDARLVNIERLRGMRTRTSDDLERALLEMEQIASQLLLLKLVDQRDAEVVRLVREVADTVQSITDALAAID